MLKICIYIGINAHVTPAHGQTDRRTHGNVKVEQYSAEAESAIYIIQYKSKRRGRATFWVLYLYSYPILVWISSTVVLYVFNSETILGLLNCLPAMLVCDPTFVGRPAPGLTQIRANSQISYLLAGECKSTISVWLFKNFPLLVTVAWFTEAITRGPAFSPRNEGVSFALPDPWHNGTYL